VSRSTSSVRIGNLHIGAGAPIAIQSMTNTRTEDVPATVKQIKHLQQAGCHIVRVAVPNQQAVTAFALIRKEVTVPLVADIHFDYRLALASMDAGADKIRINPGNIGGKERLQQVISKAVHYRVPMRIGVNSGSLEKDILQDEGGPTVNGLVRSALRQIEVCRELGGTDLVVSLKSSDVRQTIAAYEQFSQQSNVPLHIGLTEAGTVKSGSIKSSVAIGTLLYKDIGDTVRVSLTGDPVEEVFVAQEILKSLNLAAGANIISCPTCSRTEVDLVSIAEEVQRRLSTWTESITVAVMGCEVNGPGEARHADIGVACGKHAAILFRRGEILRKIPENAIVEELVAEAIRFRNECNGR
jgi:(E)-4-hydroxy-3-methylbut-2-enyl-diphosphate synthase